MVKYPEDWKVVPLSDVGDVCMCKRVLKSETSTTGDIPFYKIGTFGKTPDAYISRDLYEAYRRAYSYPKTGDVLISAAGTIGRTIVFDGADAYFQDSNIVWLNNPETTVTNDYLYWCYQAVRWQTEDGGIVARLYNGNFRATKVALPPLSEQKRIAAVLGNVDKLIDNLSRRIEKKRLVKQGVMQDLLTAKKRLPGFKGEWKRVKLGEVADIRTGKRNGDEQQQDGLYPFFVRSQTVYRIDSYSYDGEAIIVPGEGGIGSIFHYINGKFDFHQRVYKISDFPSEIACKYVYYYMRQFFGKFALQNTVKATVDSLRLPTFQAFVVALPPTLAEQKAIAGVLGAMDGEIAKLEAKLEKYRSLKQGLMNDLLTGRVRV